MTSNDKIDSFIDSLPEAISAELPKVVSMRSEREMKADGSYVTRGDLCIQDLILSAVSAQLPGAAVVSEELKDAKEASGDCTTTVVVDPIDGTENFTSGLPEWGVSVACYSGGVHVGALLGCPEMNTWLRSGAHVEKHASRIRGLSSSLSKSELSAVAEGDEYRVLGCCVYNMINVIRGSFHSFENTKGANCWDILAGLNLALEHGLTVTVNGMTYAGEYLPPTRKYRFRVEN